jgi:rhamnose utilization protein RhaD (predicted bifunctional aldolase and dehydrogenase)
MKLEELVAVSQFYGSNSDYVIAGGGNTSFKDGKYLYIKGSGTSLAKIEPEGFVKMERSLLAEIWEKNYPEEADKREEAVLADMMAARAPGEEQKRPSVETLLHDLLPFAFVVHTHPSLVNGLTCSMNEETAAAELFAGEALWIPSINPGYILSRKVKESMEEFKARTGKIPAIIFLQNHGVFVGADTVEEINAIYRRIMDTLEAKIIRKPDLSGRISVYKFSEWFGRLLCGFGWRTEKEHNWYVQFQRNVEITRFVRDRASFAPVSSAFTPDHIVYSGSNPLFIEDSTALGDKAADAWKIHLEQTGRIPKTIACQGMGIFGIGMSQKAADNAVELFIDTVKVAVYAESFGGGRFMSEDQINFINNWEVERYRSALSAK